MGHTALPATHTALDSIQIIHAWQTGSMTASSQSGFDFPHAFAVVTSERATTPRTGPSSGCAVGTQPLGTQSGSAQPVTQPACTHPRGSQLISTRSISGQPGSTQPVTQPGGTSTPPTRHPRAATGASSSYRILHTVGDNDARFPLASVTKLLSAWAVLTAVEHGLLTLDDAAGPPNSTVRHLLAHASGLPAERGEPIAPPGQRRIYSNYGFELLGDYTATRVGESFQEWIEESVLLPLGMADTDVDGSPAHSGISTVSDLALFAVELLHPTLISPELLAAAATVQFPGLAGILPGYGRQQSNDWGLGVEIRDHKQPHWTGDSFSPRTFGHFGQSGSFLWVDPIADDGAGRAGIFLGAERFGAAHVAGWPALTNAMRAWQP